MLAGVQRPPYLSGHREGRRREHRDDVGEVFGGEWDGVGDVTGEKRWHGGGWRDGRSDQGPWPQHVVEEKDICLFLVLVAVSLNMVAPLSFYCNTYNGKKKNHLRVFFFELKSFENLYLTK